MRTVLLLFDILREDTIDTVKMTLYEKNTKADYIFVWSKCCFKTLYCSSKQFINNLTKNIISKNGKATLLTPQVINDHGLIEVPSTLKFFRISNNFFSIRRVSHFSNR